MVPLLTCVLCELPGLSPDAEGTLQVTGLGLALGDRPPGRGAGGHLAPVRLTLLTYSETEGKTKTQEHAVTPGERQRLNMVTETTEGTIVSIIQWFIVDMLHYTSTFC